MNCANVTSAWSRFVRHGRDKLAVGLPLLGARISRVQRQPMSIVG